MTTANKPGSAADHRLLTTGDPRPVACANLAGASPLVILGDHAGRAIPAQLAQLGLPPAELERHIAWDIGVEGLGLALARRLAAAFIRQRYSRLVIDCNRRLEDPSSIAETSDGAAVAGNQGLTSSAKAARAREIFQPYHDRIARVLDTRQTKGRASLVFALHSFTPNMAGFARPWRFGVVHRNDSRFSKAVLQGLRRTWGEAVGDNLPYAMDGSDFTVPAHADPRGLDYLELEVRQDLIADAAGRRRIADDLSPVLSAALAECAL